MIADNLQGHWAHLHAVSVGTKKIDLIRCHSLIDNATNIIQFCCHIEFQLATGIFPVSRRIPHALGDDGYPEIFGYPAEDQY